MRPAQKLPAILLAALLGGFAARATLALPQEHVPGTRMARAEQDPKPARTKSAKTKVAPAEKSEDDGKGKPVPKEKKKDHGAMVLRGEVLAQSGAEALPLGEVEISLVMRRHGKREEVIARTASEEDGSFECAPKGVGALTRARAGKHAEHGEHAEHPERVFVRAVAPGWLPAEKRCSLSDGDWRARIELEAGILVQGRVVDAFGNPLTNATVQIEGVRSAASETDAPAIPWQVDHARSSEEGNFALGVLAAGHYALLVEKNDAGRTKLEFDVLPEARYVRLPDAVLASQASLGGVLTTSGGVPLPGVLIRAELVREQAPVTIPLPVLAPAGLVSAHTTTDAHGKFQIDGLLPGSYSLVADCNVGSVRRTKEDASPDLHEMTHLAETPLARAGDAPGTVYAADGTDLPLVLDACLLEIELQSKGQPNGNADSKTLWVGVVESPGALETIQPQHLSLVELKGKEQRATIRSTPGTEAIVVVARGGRGTGKKLGTLAVQRVPVSATPGVQHVEIDLR
jgi:hypothetical protein